MRGTKSITHGSSTDPRITPVCAGNSSFMRAKSSAIKDHPRVCGEQAGLLFLFPLLRGSPPRVRGTGNRRMKKLLPLRITPACAGNSSSKYRMPSFSKDHPRVCGEQDYILNPKREIRGSPPRVRGTVTGLL